MSETWLSREAYDRLTAELDSLRTDGRTRMAAIIEEARSHGDLRENAEYHAAKDDQGKMESRIRQLESLLRDARVGEAPADDDVVRPGLVTTLDIDGDEETYLLGSREDEHDEHEILSSASPMGQAVDGARVGETVSFRTPAGDEIQVRIVRILPS